MEYLAQFGENRVLWTAVVAWFVAQVLKIVFVFIQDRRINLKRFVGSGGMPSSHSSFSVSLAMAVGFVEGFNSVEFAICFCFAIIVMYDAAGVRRSAGQQAQVLNRMLEKWEDGNFKDTDKELKELLGHTPVEVFAGAVLGFVIALISFVL